MTMMWTSRCRLPRRPMGAWDGATGRRGAAALAPTGSDTMVNHGLLVNNPTEHCKATQWFFRTALLGNSDGMLSPSKVLLGTRGPRRHPELAVENRRPRGTPRHRCPGPGQEYPTISLPTTFKARRADFPRPPFVRPDSTAPQTTQIRPDKHFYSFWVVCPRVWGVSRPSRSEVDPVSRHPMSQDVETLIDRGFQAYGRGDMGRVRAPRRR